MKSIWTTSESQAILPSTKKTSDLQELIGDPNHDQQKLQPTPEQSKTGIWFNRQVHNQSSKSRNTSQNVQVQKAFKSKQQKPRKRPHPPWLVVPAISSSRNQKKSDCFKEFKQRWRESRHSLRCSVSGRRKGCDPEIRSVWTFEFQRYKQKTFSIFFRCSCQHLKIRTNYFQR